MDFLLNYKKKIKNIQIFNRKIFIRKKLSETLQKSTAESPYLTTAGIVYSIIVFVRGYCEFRS